MSTDIDLKDYIKISDAECLNKNSKTFVTSIFTGSEEETLESNPEVDEQLLLTIPFKGNVDLRKLRFIAETKEDSKSGPKSIKLWINTSLDFSDTEDTKPVQTLTLTEKQLTGETIDLKFSKFRNVTSLVLFVETNQDDSHITTISQLTIIGKPRSKVNMKDLKKVEG